MINYVITSSNRLVNFSSVGYTRKKNKSRAKLQNIWAKTLAHNKGSNGSLRAQYNYVYNFG